MKIIDLPVSALPKPPKYALLSPAQKEAVLDYLLPPACRHLPRWLKEAELERRQRVGAL